MSPDWYDLVADDDPAAAFSTHFGFLTAQPELTELLATVANTVSAITVADETLVVDFEGGTQLRCQPPAPFVGETVPASYARLASVHDGITLEWDDVPLSFLGVDGDGTLYPSEFIAETEGSDVFAALEAAELGPEHVSHAFVHAQNELVFSPLERTDTGEPAVYYIDHGECDPKRITGDGLCFADVLLVLLAEAILDEALVHRYATVGDETE
ncbi:hypothetical protein [Natronobiforma cellulositropha]|uniref:hypothetical protein n=1 Tax=Natronobiforma cellulositropha TaxID=1679076 RepID=UPI0021D5D6EE|nr:hypothetical protein [Natronobiforma cellulositropha]